MELTQKHLSDKRVFSIEKKGIRIKLYRDGNFIEELYKWDGIGFDETIEGYQPTKYQSLFFCSLLINLLVFLIPFTFDGNDKIIGLIIGIFTAITIILSKFFFTKKYEKSISGSYITIRFLYFEKKQKEVDEFILKIKTERNSFFKEKYLHKKSYENFEDYLSRLDWLLEEEIISENEFNNLKNKDKYSIIGFGK